MTASAHAARFATLRQVGRDVAEYMAVDNLSIEEAIETSLSIREAYPVTDAELSYIRSEATS